MLWSCDLRGGLGLGLGEPEVSEPLSEGSRVVADALCGFRAPGTGARCRVEPRRPKAELKRRQKPEKPVPKLPRRVRKGLSAWTPLDG